MTRSQRLAAHRNSIRTCAFGLIADGNGISAGSAGVYGIGCLVNLRLAVVHVEELDTLLIHILNGGNNRVVHKLFLVGNVVSFQSHFAGIGQLTVRINIFVVVTAQDLFVVVGNIGHIGFDFGQIANGGRIIPLGSFLAFGFNLSNCFTVQTAGNIGNLLTAVAQTVCGQVHGVVRITGGRRFDGNAAVVHGGVASGNAVHVQIAFEGDIHTRSVGFGGDVAVAGYGYLAAQFLHTGCAGVAGEGQTFVIQGILSFRTFGNVVFEFL